MTICKDPNCKVRASFNVEGEKKQLYCSKHKLEGMVNVASSICIHEGCNVQPKFNVEGEKKHYIVQNTS